jgi:hypothetical protein
MQHFDDSDLRDPSPPVPGDKERAAVAARAHQLGRKRRMMQGAGALGMVAAVAVGVAALTAGGTSGSGGSGRIEAASSAGTTDTTEAAVTTTVPAPVTTVPAPTADTTPAPTGTDQAPVVEAPAPEATPDTTPVAPAAPSTYTVSGTVSNIPQGVTLTLTLSGSGGTFTAIADGAGNYSMSGVPAGTYEGMYEWTDSTGTATQVGRVGGITVSGDTNFSFALQ